MNDSITGHTKMTCLIGSPVSHSISPMLHNRAFQELSLDYVYVAFDVENNKLEDAVNGLRAIGVRGFNVTMPHKKNICALCDHLSPVAQITQSVNTVVNDNGTLTGYTTDGIGFMRSLEDEGISIVGKQMTILGAGGAAASIVAQAAFDGVLRISIFNQKGVSYNRMENMIAKLRQQTNCHISLFTYENDAILRQELEKSCLLVNATSVGMGEDSHDSLIRDTSYFHKDLSVYDIIYNPRETKLLQLAKSYGLQTLNGLPMLFYQGAAAFFLWTGKEMPSKLLKTLL